MKAIEVSEESRKTLDKLEHRINRGAQNIVGGIDEIITVLHEIKEQKLFMLRGCKSIREYILALELPERINLHISSIFMKLQILDYASKHELDFKTVREIGEAKFKTIVQAGAKINEDVTLEDLKKKRLYEIEHMVHGGRKSARPNQAEQERETSEAEEKGTGESHQGEGKNTEMLLPINLSHVRKVRVDAKYETITIQLNKGNFPRYFGTLREFPKVVFEST